MRGWLVGVLAAGLLNVGIAEADDSGRISLADWHIQSSAHVGAKGEAISGPGFSTAGWHAAKVPGTIVGALVDDGTFREPFVGMNMRSIPGTSYPIGGQFSNLPMPADSPYKAAWWYRCEFELPASA